MKIAIIGAGMAGLSAAEALSRKGHNIQLFDKGRGPGGRMSTRRIEYEGRTLHFDHGATSFQAEADSFRETVEAWHQAGAVSKWQQTKQVTNADRSDLQFDEAWVGYGAMNMIIRHMSAPHNVLWSCRVISLERTHSGWGIGFEGDKEAQLFDHVVVATPLEQAREFFELARLGEKGALAPRATSSPCWTLMAKPATGLNCDWDIAEWANGEGHKIVLNHRKPNRADDPCIVLQAGPSWSMSRLELEPDAARCELLRLLGELTGFDTPELSVAHRWRFATVNKSNPSQQYCTQYEKLSFCGDWCLGADVEAAWLSGQEIARHL